METTTKRVKFNHEGDSLQSSLGLTGEEIAQIQLDPTHPDHYKLIVGGYINNGNSLSSLGIMLMLANPETDKIAKPSEMLEEVFTKYTEEDFKRVTEIIEKHERMTVEAAEDLLKNGDIEGFVQTLMKD